MFQEDHPSYKSRNNVRRNRTRKQAKRPRDMETRTE